MEIVEIIPPYLYSVKYDDDNLTSIIACSAIGMKWDIWQNSSG